MFKFLLLIIIIIVILVAFAVKTVRGGRADPALEALKLVKPYIKDINDFEEYLEEYYDYTNSEIKRFHEKSKKLIGDVGKKYAYLYYLLSDIADNNNYINPYELLYNSDVDASSFVSEHDRNAIRKLNKKYTRADENELLKIFDKMELDVSRDGLKRFLSKNKYFVKKGRKIVPDTLALMNRAWDYFGSKEIVYIPPVQKTPIIEKVYYIPSLRERKKTMLEQLREDRETQLKLEKEIAEREYKREKAEREKEKAIRDKEKTEQEEQYRKEKAEREIEYSKNQFELHKRMFEKALRDDPSFANEVIRRRNEGANTRDIFDEWVLANPIITGAEDTTRISDKEIEQALDNILNNIY